MSGSSKDQSPRNGREKSRKTIFEIGDPEGTCQQVLSPEIPEDLLATLLGDTVRSEPAALPAVTELDLMRHYTALASMNFGVDSGMYPLGSCTMKYNPRINEDACRLPGFAGVHPYQPANTVQGVLELMWNLQYALAEISGLPAVTLQPAAGAHGEHTALMCIRAFHADNGDPRRRVLIPDTAHGTNPATVSMCGYETTTIPSDAAGGVDMSALSRALDYDVAAVMLTNPNTLGLFDTNIARITEAVHAFGALAYCDGANLNAIMGISRPGDMGFDAMHINLHKTFSTPHGGGGPGAGPVCVSDTLAPYLPGPVVVNDEGHFRGESPSRSIGRVRSFWGNVGVLVRAYTYIRALGGDGLLEASQQAVLSANYLKEHLRCLYALPYDRTCMHEFVLSASEQKRTSGVRALDIAKRLLDYGIHPPTIYFPLLVEEALMIEPTETESLASLDDFISAMTDIAEESISSPETLKSAPYTTFVRRVDEARAAREPDLRWSMCAQNEKDS